MVDGTRKKKKCKNLLLLSYFGYPVRTQHPGQKATSMDTGAPIFPISFRELSAVPAVTPPICHHSLIAERESLPDCLEITAWTDDGLIMGLEHRQFEIHGVQFHPESIESEYGHDLLRNFLDRARTRNAA